MKGIILILAVLACSSAFAGDCKNGSCKVQIPTVGRNRYKIQHPAIIRSNCKNGKCSVQK